MTDDQKAKEMPESETQESSMPDEEQKTQEAPETTEESPKEEGLPEDAKERTKREFEKLRQELREERQQRERLEKAFTTLQPKKEEPKLPELIDPETGLFNKQAMNERDRLILEAQDRAKRAEEAAQRYVAEQENQRMFAAHPELDPESEVFDQDLHKLTSALLLKSMISPEDFGGKQLSGVEAGKLAKSYMKKGADVAKQEGAKEALEQITPKEQASLEASGSSNRRTQIAPKLDELRHLSRKGGQEGLEAIVERLKSVPDKS